MGQRVKRRQDHLNPTWVHINSTLTTLSYRQVILSYQIDQPGIGGVSPTHTQSLNPDFIKDVQHVVLDKTPHVSLML